MQISCVIVEDLPAAAAFLKKYCAQHGLLDVKEHFTNVQDAVAYLNENVVDLIFLDVEMPDATGFDLLDQLCYLPRIIMTTSKTEYAFDAFKYQATDYLKKPFTYQQFLKAIEKVQASIAQAPIAQPSDIFIKVDGKLIKINLEEVLYIESMGDYVKFVTPQKTYTSLYTMKSLEEKLSGPAFLRVHRSYLVNVSRINNLDGNLINLNGVKVPVSKAHREEVVRRLQVL